MSVRISRRRMLTFLGWSGTGVTVVAAGVHAFLPALPSRHAPAAADAAAWVSLRPESHFELYSPRVEMGQGIAVSLRQIVAEELGVELTQVRWLSPDTAFGPVCRATVGSDSIRDFAPLLAQAAAALAVALRTRAAERLGSRDISLEATGARAANGRRASFRELATGKPLLLDENAVGGAAPRSLASKDALRVVGRGAPTEGIAAIVTGNGALFTDDIRPPGMIYGAIVKSEGLNGVVSAVDDTAARPIPGYIGLVSGRNFTGLLAARRGALQKALAAVSLEDEYDRRLTTADTDRAIGLPVGERSYEHVAHDAAIDPLQNFDIDLRLSVPLAAHASIEPRTAIASFAKDGRLEVWTGTQDVFFVRDTLAKALGLSRSGAAGHGMSARSLQRRLAECGWTLRAIVAAMRLQVAANLLSQTDMPIALVGLYAGYSDQPHFQREFRKGLGPTPRIYRQLSQASENPARQPGSRIRGSEGF